jgi:hypothetical protein
VTQSVGRSRGRRCLGERQDRAVQTHEQCWEGSVGSFRPYLTRGAGSRQPTRPDDVGKNQPAKQQRLN